MTRNIQAALAAATLLALAGCFDRGDENGTNMAAPTVVTAPGERFNSATTVGNATMSAIEAGEDPANAAANASNAGANLATNAANAAENAAEQE